MMRRKGEGKVKGLTGRGMVNDGIQKSTRREGKGMEEGGEKEGKGVEEEGRKGVARKGRGRERGFIIRKGMGKEERDDKERKGMIRKGKGKRKG